MLSDHVGADIGMAAHYVPLVITQRSWFVQNVIPDADFAEVMKRSGRAKLFTFTVAQIKMLPKPPS